MKFNLLKIILLKMQPNRHILKIQTKPSLSIPINIQILRGHQARTQRQIFNHPLNQSCSIRKDVVYDNQIFNIKKKFTMCTEPEEYQPRTKETINDSTPKYKHSEYFSKFIDNVQKNRQLLRRGPCDIPLSTQFLNQGNEKKRHKTDVQVFSNARENKKSFRSVNSSKLNAKNKVNKQGIKIIKDLAQTQKKDFPLLDNRTKYQKQQHAPLPIRVQKFVSKAISWVRNLSPQDLTKRNKNIMLRKLDVELINYQLLGKWINTPLKS